MKSNSQDKTKKTLTPVTLIDQNQEFKQNSILIGKMFGQNLANSIPLAKSNNLFSAGFKYRLETEEQIKQKQTQLKNKKKLVESALKSSTNKSTVYDQFGIINDSIGKNKSKPKYRDQMPSNSNGFNNFLQVQENVNQMKKNRDQKIQNIMGKQYVNLYQYYDLAKQKDRQQTVIHVKSSLDTVSLQNIEAKLEAHRRQLQPIEDQYNLKFGKVPKQKENNQPKHLLNFSDNFYNQNSSKNQVYQLIKKTQNQNHDQVQFENMWAEKLSKNPKLAQYDKKYQEYLVQKDAKNMLGGVVRKNLFVWEKSTQVQSKKQKPTIKKSISKQRNYSKSPSKQGHNQISQQELKCKDIAQIISSKDDKFIAKYIFSQIDVQKRGLLSKQELLDFITKNQHIIKGYNFDMKWIFTDLDNFTTKRKGMLAKEQLALFLATFQKAKHPQIILKPVNGQKNKIIEAPKVDVSKKSRLVVNFSRHRKTFQKLFQSLDITDDKLLKREEYIQSIYLDAFCSKLLDEVAVQINAIQKKITYRQIISLILDDQRKQKNQKLKKSKEYLTFQRFCQYFQFPQTIDLRQIQTKKRNKAEQTLTKQHQLFDIEPQQLLILKDIFSTIPRIYQDFITSADFIQTSLLDPLVLSFQDQLCRIQSVQTELPIQTIKQTLHRMIRQCEQYADWQTIKGFLSRRGRPLDWNQQMINKKKQLRQQKRQESINEALKKQVMEDMNIPHKSKSQLNRKREVDRYTIPQPFHITDQQKKAKQAEINKGQEQFKQLNTFKAKPVNKQILEPKPQLIAGKRKQSSQKSRVTYNYQNYQNDRIERALKKAQQQYELEQQKIKIKQQAQIKAVAIGIDLTKKYQDVIKEQQKKKQKQKQKQGKNIIDIVVNQRLYPKDIKKQAERKRQKMNQKQQKLKQAQKRKKQEELQKKKSLQEKNKQTREKMSEIKKQKELDQAQRQKLKVGDLQFKPKINKRNLSKGEKDTLQKGKADRQMKNKQKEQQKMEIMENIKRKRLQHQKKDPYKLCSQFQNNSDIIANIYDIKFQDLLLEEDKQQFRSNHDFKDKSKKQVNVYWNGLANRFRLAMQKQDKMTKLSKKQQMQKAQSSNIKKQSQSTLHKNQKTNNKKLKSDMTFNKSKALRRYRQIMDGKSPSQVPSQFDHESKIGENFYEDQKTISGIQQNQEDQSENQSESN